MKILSNILGIAIVSLSFLSCKSVIHDTLQTGSIVRDCTGTYIRVSEKEDYLVCNADMLKDKKEGEKVSAVFEMTKECLERDGKIMCMMYHENKGMIRIKSVK